jgi:hypothetical protein
VKILNKSLYGISKIRINIIKALATFFFIFSLIPWVNFNLNNLDSQPWSFFFAIIFLVCLKKVTFPAYSNKIFIITIIGLCFTFIKTNSIDIFYLLRTTINYLSLPILYIAFYNYFIRYNFPLKLLVIFNFLWIGFGFLQSFFPKIKNFIVYSRNFDESRGVSSLAPEPTFFAIYLFFSSWLLIEVKNLVISNNIKILLFINFLTVIFLAKSSMGFLYYAIVTSLFIILFLFYFFIDLKLKKKSMLSFIIYFIMLFIVLKVFENLLQGSRLIFLIDQVVNYLSIVEIIMLDASINSRVESVYFSIIGSFKNYLLPGGIDTFIEMRSEILDSTENSIFYNRYESNKIMSWIGSIIYEMGIFGIMIIIFFFKAIYRNFRGSLFYFATLFLILLSAIPVAFPLIPMLFSLLVYNKKL